MFKAIVDLGREIKNNIAEDYKEVGKGVFVSYSFNEKFRNDCVEIDNSELFIVIEGVFFNKSDLLKENIGLDFSQLVAKLFLQYDRDFLKSLSGIFRGMVYDKRNGEVLFFTDHIAEKKLFYYKNSDLLIVGDSLGIVRAQMEIFNIGSGVNRNAAYCFLTYGYLLDDITLCDNIKRILPASYLQLRDNVISHSEYFNLTDEPDHSIDMKKGIEGIDHYFRKAVDRSFQKDKEYGYKHIACLSGGLDSRMVNWVASDLGYSPITSITFSQSGYSDFKVAQDISRELRHEWLFKTLDDGFFMHDLEKLIACNNGMTSFSGQAHLNSMIEKINFSEYGILHTGQLGDVIIGSYARTHNYNPPTHRVKAASQKLFHKLTHYDISKYPNEEMFVFNNRGLNGILTGDLPVQQYTETFSPFLDKDFLSYALSVPLKYRAHHRIYFEWINSCYPKAAKHKWESINARIDSKKIIFRKKVIALKNFPSFVITEVIKKLGVGGLLKIIEKKGMNPYLHWYNSNEDIQKFFALKFDEGKSLNIDKELMSDCIMLYDQGNIYEKMMVLSFFESVKRYCKDV